MRRADREPTRSRGDLMGSRPAVAFFSLCTVMVLFSVPSWSQSQEQSPGTDMSLEQAVEMVLQRSPLGQAADANLTAAEQGKSSVRGEFLPKLKTQMDFTLTDTVPEIAIPPLLPGMEPVRFIAGDDRILSSKTTLEQPVFTGLALLSQYRLADLDRRQAVSAKEDTRQGLILQTYENYYSVLVAEKAVAVADQSVTQLESHAEVARQFFENGMIPKNDLLKTQVSLAETKRRRIEAVHALDLAWSRLRTLLRVDEREGPLRLTEQLGWKPYEASLEECISTALRQRPQLLLTQLDVDKAEKGVTLARSGFYPAVALVGAVDHEEGGFIENPNQLSATVHASWNVWEWGANYYKVQQSKSMVTVAKARHTQAVDTVKLQVRAAYLSVKEWRESIDVAKASIEQAEENYRITVEQYKENVTTSTEVLDAQTLQAQAQMNYYSALSNYNIALARLQQSMGTLQGPVC